MPVQCFTITDEMFIRPTSVDQMQEVIARQDIPGWIDVQGPASEWEDILKAINVHPFIYENCISTTTTSRFSAQEKTIFMSFPAPTSQWDRFERVFTKIVYNESVLVTFHEKPIESITILIEDLQKSVQLNKPHPSAVLYNLLDYLVDQTVQHLLTARTHVDELALRVDTEDELIEISEILALKRTVGHLGLACENQLYCLTGLLSGHTHSLTISEQRNYLRDLQGELNFILRSVTRQEERLKDMHQHYLLTLQEKTNRRLSFLAVISAIFLPLTLVAGIYGMNFQRMPELQWTWGYPAILGFMVLLATCLLIFFKFKGWLD